VGSGAGPADRGRASGDHPPAAVRQGALLRAVRHVSLPPSRLSGPGARRARNPRHAGPRRARALRPRRGVGGRGGLRLRRVAGRLLLPVHPPLLACPSGRD
jgi:hypothetical protein